MVLLSRLQFVQKNLVWPKLLFRALHELLVRESRRTRSRLCTQRERDVDADVTMRDEYRQLESDVVRRQYWHENVLAKAAVSDFLCLVVFYGESSWSVEGGPGP